MPLHCLLSAHAIQTILINQCRCLFSPYSSNNMTLYYIKSIEHYFNVSRNRAIFEMKDPGTRCLKPYNGLGSASPFLGLFKGLTLRQNERSATKQLNVKEVRLLFHIILIVVVHNCDVVDAKFCNTVWKFIKPASILH